MKLKQKYRRPNWSIVMALLFSFVFIVGGVEAQPIVRGILIWIGVLELFIGFMLIEQNGFWVEKTRIIRVEKA